MKNSVSGLAGVIRKRDGAIAVLTGILMLLLLLSIAAIAVDVNFLMAGKNELQNVADGAALAATRQLGDIYSEMSYYEQITYTCDPGLLASFAQEIALQNKAAGKNIAINAADVEPGIWMDNTFTPATSACNAIRVTSRRDDLANGPVATFFARTFGQESVPVTGTATAALTGLSSIDEGGLPLPVGISKAWFLNKEEFCDQPIKFYPTNSPEGCAGWHTYTESPANASKLRSILEGLASQTYLSPEAEAGVTEVVFSGGTVASAFGDMKFLFDTMKVLNDGVLDSDDNSNTWTTTVIVYDSEDCSNPTGSTLVIGFATVVITEILEAPDKIINARVICENTEPGEGGGSYYGTWGEVPNLVE